MQDGVCYEHIWKFLQNLDKFLNEILTKKLNFGFKLFDLMQQMYINKTLDDNLLSKSNCTKLISVSLVT